MSSTEAPISITVKTPAGSLVTVRAESGAELDMVVAMSLDALKSAVTELEGAVRGANAAVPPAPAIAAIATQFGGAIVSEHVNPESFSTAPSAGARQCPHGTMTRIHGMTGKFGPYKGHFCPAKQGDPTKCTTQYVKAGSPEFATFVADQTKA
jgi:hypothetical protein